MFSPDIIALVDRFKIQKPTGNFQRWEPALYNKLVEETTFLPPVSALRQRLWHIEHNTGEIPTCNCCSNHVSWNSDDHLYRKFCSSSCGLTSLDTITLRQSTMLEKYGVENYTTAIEFNQQRISTSIEKRGTEWATQTKDTQTKIRNTCLEKYGNSHYTKTQDYADKTKQTSQQKWGVNHPSQSRILPESLLLLQSKDWLYNQHYTLTKTITTIANELEVDTTTVVSYLMNSDLTVQRFSSSQPERDICKFLESLKIVNIVTNDRSILSGLELDILLPDYNIAIEFCGLYWHSTAHQRITPTYHKLKLDACNKQGIRLLTIFEDEWLHNQLLVQTKLQNILQPTTEYSIGARKCKNVEVPTPTKIIFLDKYHIQGNGPSSINVGLEYNNELVACMSFIKKKDGIFILNRYATSKPVVGGFSKLLAHFTKTNDWKEIVSFADMRWSQGGVYIKNGFTLDNILPPDYEYVDTKNRKRIHKFNFRHKNLPKILGNNYNPLLSETQNTFNNRWYKIYNCGLLRYVMKK